MFRSFLISTTLLSLTAASIASAQDTVQNGSGPVVSKGYPIDVCVVTGRPLEPGKITRATAAGRAYELCTEACAMAVKAAPEVFGAKLDTAIIAAQKPSYPLQTCAVTGEPLAKVDQPVDLVLDNRLVILASADQVAAAKRRRNAIQRSIVTAAWRAQQPRYPLKTCVVSGAELGEQAIDVIHGTTLVRLADTASLRRFDKTPGVFLRKLGRGVTAGAVEASGCCGACVADQRASKPTGKECCREKAAEPAAKQCCQGKASKAGR